MDRRRRLLGCAGRNPWQDVSAQAKTLPKTGDAFSNAGNCAGTWVGGDRPGVVEAGDVEERLHRVVLEGAVGVARGVGVGEQHQRLVPSPESADAERGGQQDPVVAAVERDRDPVERVAGGELAVAGGQRLRRDRVDQVADRAAARRRTVVTEEAADRRRSTQFAAYASRARSKPAACWSVELPRAEGRVDGAVEHEAADPVGEELGVGRSRAWCRRRRRGSSSCSHRARPAGRPCRGRTRRSRRGRPARPTAGCSPSPIRCCCARNATTSPGVEGSGSSPRYCVELGVAEAVDRRAVAGAARVEAHDVEVLEQRLRRRPARPARRTTCRARRGRRG